MQKTVVCPRCNGSRIELRQIEPKPGSPVDAWSQYKYTKCYIQCEQCNGTGTITRTVYNDAANN